MANRTCFLSILLILVILGCQEGEEETSLLDLTPYDLTIPPHLPNPGFPDDNELTQARVALGKKLFFDPNLSADGTISCASCHKQELAFADHLAISPGIQGKMGMRNSPTLANLAYLTAVNKDGGVPKLDLQALVPIADAEEMGADIFAVAERLNADPAYNTLFYKAYDQEANAFTITRALGAFQRTMISGNSPYDQYLQGDLNKLSQEAERGRVLFFSERTQCSSCHSGFNLTNNAFENNGLYLEYEDPGRQGVTVEATDVGKFRVPTLRNVGVTAPYMHDGSLLDLAAVIEHYNQGGKGHSNQSELLRPLSLTNQEKADLVQFLLSLTDTDFLTNPIFQP